jgi:hypothetical protein
MKTTAQVALKERIHCGSASLTLPWSLPDFCAVHESGNGPKRRFLNVRFCAAFGVRADLARTSLKRR